MLYYYGLKATNEELDKIDNLTKKIMRFYSVPADIHISVNQEGKDKINFNLYVVYRNKRVSSEKVGTDKVILCRECVDDVIQQIKKIKTSYFPDRTTIKTPIVDEENDNVMISKTEYDKKLSFLNKELYAENISDQAAVDRLEAEGLSFYVYRNKDIIKIVTRNANKGYSVFEVIES